MLLVAAGCATGPFARNQAIQPPPLQTPRGEQIVAHLNQNARVVHSLEFDRVSIQAKRGLQSVMVDGMLAYQKPRNFRLMAEAVGTTQADVGSNDEEFWFMFKDGGGALYRCAHEDLPRVRSLAVPLHPDWVAEALCVQDFGPADQYQVRTTGQQLQLIGQTAGPQGQSLQRITTVALAGPNRGRIVGLQVRTAQGAEIWSADITEYHQNANGYLVPRKITLRCPAEKMEVQFKLDGLRINGLVAQSNPNTFRRPGGYEVIDLARGSNAPASPQSIQRTRGSSP
jgi:hypothetical protein